MNKIKRVTILVLTAVLLALPLAGCGSKGKQGPAGENGTSINWLGSLGAAPSSPQVDDAYYNTADGKSYVWDGSAWQILAENGTNGAQGPAGLDGISINWLGSLSTAPSVPRVNDAYYDTTAGISFVWDGSAWKILSQNGAVGPQGTVGPQGLQGIQGLAGTNGTNGTNGISINWKGSFSSAPSSPALNDAYYNSTDKTSYIWGGTSWQILAKDGATGSQGIQGVQGLPGNQGIQGIQGIQGPQGVTGPTMPVIQSLSVWKLPADPGATVTVTVAAQSAQGLGLTYAWVTSPATWVIASGQGTSVIKITAPSTYAAGGTATVTVTDTLSRSAVGAVGLATVGNLAPVISTMTASPNPAWIGQTGVVISVTAADPNGDALGYSWSVPAGWAITGGAATSQITATAAAVYSSSGNASVIVTDGKGGSVTGYITVGTIANAKPVIESIAIYPQPATAANFICNAEDPYGDALSYSWKVGGVYPGVVTGANWYWYSQGIPGYYGVDVRVRDGSGATASGSSFMNVSSGSPWPRFHRDIQSTGISPYAGAVTNTLKWRYQTGGVVNYSSPAIGVDGIVYVGSLDWYLYAIRPDGTLKWRYQTGGQVNSSPAVSADGTVYVGSNDSWLYAIRPDGTLKWKYQTGDAGFSSPAIGADGTVYVGSLDGNLSAINPDGTFKWSYPTGNSIYYSSPAIGADGTVYVGSEDWWLYAIRPDGMLKWRYQTGSLVRSSPAIGADGTVYVGSEDWYLYAIRPDGTRKWRYQTGGPGELFTCGKRGRHCLCGVE